MINNPYRFASYVIVDRVTGKAVLEVFNGDCLSYLKTDRFEAWPIVDWLYSLNRGV